MKKSSRKKSRRGVASASALAASFLVVPVLAAPSPVWAQAGTRASSQTASQTLKFAAVYVKLAEQFTIVGLEGTRPVYQNARGEYFYLDPATGDMKFLSPETFSKDRSLVSKTWKDGGDNKYGGTVTLMGIDALGNVVHKNRRGELFYLSPTTGDMVFVR